MSTTDKQADLAGPGIGTYEEVAEALPKDYEPLLTRRETMEALFEVKKYIEDGLAEELNLMMVQVPLIVDETSGVNDYLDRDRSRTPVQFPCGLGLDEPIQAQVVQAATKWKRMALKTFDCQVGQGINTEMKAVRKDYFLELPYHQAIMNDRIPLSIGGGIGQSRTYMYLLKKAHLGEVSVTVWPETLKKISAAKNIHVLE